MKRRALLTCALAAAAATALPATPAGGVAAGEPFTLRIGDSAGYPDRISIAFARDAAEYVVSASRALPAPTGSDCRNPAPDELRCPAAELTGFEIRARGGDDRVLIGAAVKLPALVSGGAGADVLAGGGVADRLMGGFGADRLIGRGGGDFLYGNRGPDTLVGGPAADLMRGGPGADVLRGGAGADDERQ